MRKANSELQSGREAFKFHKTIFQKVTSLMFFSKSTNEFIHRIAISTANEFVATVKKYYE